MELTYADILSLLVTLRDRTANPTDDEDRFFRFCLANAVNGAASLQQDLWVAFELNRMREGFFVEFGAFDGVTTSNTVFLERALGWRGIVAEAARVCHSHLRRNRTCSIDERCVWSESGRQLTFNQTAAVGYSTIDAFSGHDRHFDKRVEGTHYEVETVSLNDLLVHWNAPRRIDYLSVDTEGSELEILRAFDFDAWDVRLISVEHNHHPDQRGRLFELLASKGYERRFENLSRDDDWYRKTS